jgi:ferredoxin-NADP reductase
MVWTEEIWIFPKTARDNNPGHGDAIRQHKVQQINYGTSTLPTARSRNMSTYNARFTSSEFIADGTKAFHFERPAGFNFKAGQAIDLVLPATSVNDVQLARHTFSIVSAPHENCLTIATRMRDSPFKQAMNTLSEGADVGLDGPFGSLTLHSNRQRPAIFIAGGIGITPFVSILRQAAKEQLAQKFILIYSNRRPEDAAFLAEFQAHKEQMPNLQFIPTMTQISQSKQTWSGKTGQIDAGILKQAIAGQLAPIYYLAGPPTFVETMQDLLNENGVEDDDIRSEGFYGY